MSWSSRQVLLPLSNFSIVGMRREASSKFISNSPYSRNQMINFLVIKLNINLNAQTLEQLRCCAFPTSCKVSTAMF